MARAGTAQRARSGTSLAAETLTALATSLTTLATLATLATEIAVSSSFVPSAVLYAAPVLAVALDARTARAGEHELQFSPMIQPPGSLEARAVSATRVDLYWGKEAGAGREFVVLRDGRPVTRTRGSFYSDGGLRPGTRYVYTLQAISAFGETSKPGRATPIETLPAGRYAPFTLAILPDTQIYSERHPRIFTAMTRWLRDAKVERNIAYTLHVGDIVNNNAPEEWKRASRSMKQLEAVLPYAIVPGNHDMGPGGVPLSRDTTLLNETFPVARFESTSGLRRTYRGRIENSYHHFSAGGVNWLILALEYAPREPVLRWADKVISIHPGRRVIVLTHAYLAADGTPLGTSPDHPSNPANGPLARLPGGAADGAALWERLIRRHPNVLFVFSGHVLHDAARAVSQGDAGNDVFAMMANYQKRRGGGGGFLRLVEISPELGRVAVRTYSPVRDEWLTDDANQFTFEGVAFGAPVRRQGANPPPAPEPEAEEPSTP